MSAGEPDLRKRAMAATIWSGSGAIVRLVFHLAITVILARLLSPEEFGTVALLSLFIGIAGVFADSGFSCAMVQRKALTDDEMSTVFIFSVISSIVVAALLALAAPVLAAFYRVPELQLITYVLAVTMILGAVGSVHGVILSKRLDFKSQAWIEIAAKVISGCVAIALAFSGFGVWSLVAQVFAGTITTTILLWAVDSWRPKMVFEFRALRTFFKFGSYILATNLLDTVYGRINTLLIGRMYSVRDLGIYSRADSTQQLPASILTEIVNRVAFPAFSATNHDLERMRRGLRKALGGVNFLNMPMMLGLIAIAEPLVHFVFGAKWADSVPYFQILCLGGILHPANRLNASALVAQGHSKQFFRVEVAKKLIGLSTMLLASQVSIAALAWSQVFNMACAWTLGAHYTGKYLSYPLLAQARDLLPYALAGLAMFVSLLAWPDAQFPNPVGLLVAKVSCGALIYVTLCAVMRAPALAHTLDLFRSPTPAVPK